MPSFYSLIRFLLLVGGVLLLTGTSTRAGTTWDGGGANDLWSTANNWNANGVPANDGTQSLAFGGTTRLTPDMDANWSINSLTFNSGAGAFTLASTGAFTLTIQGGGITNSSTSTETINNAITLGAAQTWSATSGALSFGGNIANGGFLLTISGGSNTTASGVISGTGGLTKSGTGTLTLTGTNTYSGTTTVSAGILSIQNASGLGSTAAGTTVSSGATLQLQNSITVGAEALTISGTGASGQNGALVNVSGTNNYGGLLTLGAASTISSDSGTLNLTNTGTITGATFGLTLTGAGNGTVSSIIGTTSGTLTKSGTGTWTLTGANTYTGATTVSAGILNIQNATSLGTTAAGTTVSSGATLQLQNSITVGAEALTISGTGASGQNGALVNVSGTNNYGGLLTLGAASTISSNSGTLNLTNTGTITGATFGLTLTGSGNGTISSIIGTTSGTLTKSGTGTWTLSGNNTYTGGTTFNAGIISISSDANLGASSGSLTFSGGALYATDNVVGSRAIIMTGAGVFYGTFGKTLEESGVVSGNGNITVANSGTLILSGSGSNGTGTTTLSSGVLSLRGTVSLGSGNLSFVSGLLELGNSDFTRALGTGAGQVNMNSASGGAGFAAFGADRSVNLGGSGATVTWGAGNFVASGQTLYLGTPTADHMLDFQNPIDLNGASRTVTVTDGVGTGIDAKLTGVISGTGTSNFVMSAVGFAPWNPGSLLLSNGNNSYTGTTTINAGTLLLGANATGTAGNTVLGSGATDVLVGNTTGALNAGLLTNGAFTISRNIRAQSGNTGTTSIGGNTADASTFSGNIFLGTNGVATGKGVTLTAASGGTVTFSGTIQDATGVTTPGVVTKADAGTVVLNGANTYTGATTVSAGVLNIQNANALGTTTNGTTVSSGATLQLQNNIAVGAEGLTISGTGASGQNGALVNVSGTNNYGGLLTLGASATISSDSDTLNLTDTGTITGATFGLTLTGSGDGSVSSIIGTTTGTVTKSGTGTWTLSGANTFTGAITVNGGVLSISNENNLGGTSSTADFTLNGATLRISGANVTVATSLRNLVLGASGGTINTINNLVWDNGISGTGSLTKTGAGSFTFQDPTTFTGALNINAGSVIFDQGNDRLADVVAVTIASGTTLDVNTRSDTIGSLAGAGTLTNAGATAATITFGGLNTDTTFSGTITDATGVLNLVKQGSGTTIFSGANTYDGTITINAGSLFVNGSTAATSAVTVNNSGTTLGGNGTINGSINVASSGANLSPGASGVGSTAILRTGALTLSSSSNFNVDLNNTTAGTGYDQASVTGIVSITGSNVVVMAGSSLNIGDKFFILLNDSTDAITGTFTQGATVTSSSNGDIFSINYADNGDGGGVGNDISLTVTAVPEPSTYFAGILALSAVGYHQRRRFVRLHRLA